MKSKRQETYNKRFYVRLTEKERELLRKTANETGYQNESQYLRHVINYPNEKLVSTELLLEIKGLINAINKIGVNINQIVKNNNSHLYLEYDKRKLYALLKQFNNILCNIVNKMNRKD